MEYDQYFHSKIISSVQQRAQAGPNYVERSDKRHDKQAT
jgi:hypothetical protein